MPGVSTNLPIYGIFGPGFQLQTKDEEFQLQIHDLTQIDGRFYTQGKQVPVTSTFLIPRQWVIFSGRLTKPFEYYVSIAEGIDNLNILDVFLNVNFDPRLQFKIGRYKTPFTYEFYGLPINGFITPERSLFFNNFGFNRDIGLMAWGQTVRHSIRATLRRSSTARATATSIPMTSRTSPVWSISVRSATGQTTGWRISTSADQQTRASNRTRLSRRSCGPTSLPPETWPSGPSFWPSTRM